MSKHDLEDITCSTYSKPPIRKIVRKRSDASPCTSNRSETSPDHFKYFRLDKTLYTTQKQEPRSSSISQEPRLSEHIRQTITCNTIPPQKVRLSMCTYQSSLVHKKRMINGQPIDSKEKISNNIQKPAQIIKEDKYKVASKQSQLTQSLTKQLENKTKECRSLQIQNSKLLKLNKDLDFKNVSLEQENKTLKEYIDRVKKRLDYEQQMFKKITNLGNLQTQKIHMIQTHREEYLEKQINELKFMITENKSSNQKMLEAELDGYKSQLYQANKTIEAMQVNNNCLQMKLKEKVQMSRYIVGQDAVRLKSVNKKLSSDLDLAKKAYNALHKQYLKIVQSRVLTEQSFSLEYSNLA